MLGSMYKSVFGESVQANAQIKSLLNQEAVKTAAQGLADTDSTHRSWLCPAKGIIGGGETATIKIQEMVEEYNKMNTADKVKYLNAINNEVNKSR